MQLITLEKRRERGDLITIYKLKNNLEETDRKDEIIKRKGEVRYFMRQEKKLQKGICLNDKKLQNSPEKNRYLNGPKEEVIMAKNVQQLKEKLDKYRYGDRTT